MQKIDKVLIEIVQSMPEKIKQIIFDKLKI